MKIAMIASFTAKAGHRDALITALQQNIATVRENEPGCLQCDLLTPAEGDDNCTLYEVYASADAFETHRTMPYGPELYARIQPHIAGMPNATRFEIVES